MGFSYNVWKAIFYPINMKSESYLTYYSRIFNSVEIDSTFYGLLWFYYRLSNFHRKDRAIIAIKLEHL